ncbi:MAG: CPBP family intramembrane metalloprotease [Actinobacteria bacterium]|nr:CPBP family intramembrane metalloprotease [Actinomycetota bacterium]
MQTTSAPTSSEHSDRRRSLVGIGAWVVVATILTALGVAGSRETGRELIYEYEFAIGGAIFYGVVIALTFAISTAYGRPSDVLGFRSFARRWVWIAIGVVVAAFVVGVVSQAISGVDAGEEQGILPETWRPDRLPALVLNGLVTVTLVPFTEELFYRGLGVPVFLVFGAPVAIVVTSVVFGASHGILVALPPLVAFAAGLAWMRIRSDSLWPCVFAHGLYNGVVLALALALALA